MLLSDAEIGIHHTALPLVERTQRELDGLFDSLRMHTLIGQRRILIYKYRQQAQVGPMAQWGIHRERQALLAGRQFVLHILRNLVESRLLLDGLLDSLTHMYHRIVHEAHALRCIEAGCRLHQAHVALAHEILHRQPLSLVLSGHAHHELQVRLYESRQRPFVALQDLGREFTLLLVSEQSALTDFIQISV